MNCTTMHAPLFNRSFDYAFAFSTSNRSIVEGFHERVEFALQSSSSGPHGVSNTSEMADGKSLHKMCVNLLDLQGFGLTNRDPTAGGPSRSPVADVASSSSSNSVRLLSLDDDLDLS